MKEKRILPNWCKAAKIAMIRRDITTAELAKKIYLTREHVTGVLNGRIYSKKTIQKISDALGIKEPEESVAQNFTR